MLTRFASLVISALCLSAFCIAQPLSVSISEVNAVGLPTIRLKVCLERNGMVVPDPGRAQYLLTENGIPVATRVDCPDSGVLNSIVFTLDNSGTMAGPAITELGRAASMLVDSLRPIDEAAIVTFGSGVFFRQDFTTDKVLLKSVLNAMTAGGSTPLYEAIMFSIQQLLARGGKKVCIVLTDGLATVNSPTPDEIIAAAKSGDVILYTIGFGNTSLSDRILDRMARETGGRYFRIFGTSELAAIFQSIASEIVNPCCTISYDAASCEDSVRALTLTATYRGETATTSRTDIGPHRSDTLRLTVDAPPEVGPNGNAIVYFRLEPGLHTGLQLSFSFLVRFDPNLLAVNPLLPITVGTITQNALVSLRSLRPGVLLFSAELIRPGMASGNLVGVRFRGVASDSSRPVILSIDSLEFMAGCPNTVFVTNDTIEVCQCKREVFAWLPVNGVIPLRSEVRIPITTPDTSFAGRAVFVSRLMYDANRLTPVHVESGGIVPQDAIRWEVSVPGELRVWTPASFLPTRDTIIYIAVFQSLPPIETDSALITLPYIRAYAQCCPAAREDGAVTYYMDGICESIVTRRNVAALKQNIPNPANPTTRIEYSISANETRRAVRVRLSVFDATGRHVIDLVNDERTSGNYTVTFDTSSLPSGAYTYTLTAGEQTLTRMMMVVK